MEGLSEMRDMVARYMQDAYDEGYDAGFNVAAVEVREQMAAEIREANKIVAETQPPPCVSCQHGGVEARRHTGKIIDTIVSVFKHGKNDAG